MMPAAEFETRLGDYRGLPETELSRLLSELLAGIRPADEEVRRLSRERWMKVAKPLGSLGLFEDAITEAAAAQGQTVPDFSGKALVIFGADNGIVREGVTQTDSGVTRVVMGHIAGGCGCCSRMAILAGTPVYAIDVGMLPREGAGERDAGEALLISRVIRPGTADFLLEDAMTRREALAAIMTGADAARVLREDGSRICAAGEMGIGNTTTGCAVLSVLTGEDPEVFAGRGAGLGSEGLLRKTEVVRGGIAGRNPDASDPVAVLAAVGGLDIAALCGFYLGCARQGLPVVLDGYISLAAALAAFRLSSAAGDYMLASHVSDEPGTERILDILGLKAPIRGKLRLGEGTGALFLFPMLDMALAIYRDMVSFDEMGIESYKPLT